MKYGRDTLTTLPILDGVDDNSVGAAFRFGWFAFGQIFTDPVVLDDPELTLNWPLRKGPEKRPNGSIERTQRRAAG